MAMRIHRHASLISRRKQLQSLSMSQTHTVSMLKQSIKSRLVFATVRRALQMDALGCCPDGLAILAFTDLATSSRIRSAGSRVKCEVSVPKAILLPLLDELLCTYDSFREALWPVEDPVLAYLSRSMGQQWNSSQENPVRRAADARVALPSFAIAIQHVMTSTILRQLRPNMMLDWALHVTDTEVRDLDFKLCVSQTAPFNSTRACVQCNSTTACADTSMFHAGQRKAMRMRRALQ